MYFLKTKHLCCANCENRHVCGSTLLFYVHLCYLYICYSCNMGTSDLPDMYAQSLTAAGIHNRQITSAHVTANM